jgi:hypothetical protein
MDLPKIKLPAKHTTPVKAQNAPAGENLYIQKLRGKHTSPRINFLKIEAVC